MRFPPAPGRVLLHNADSIQMLALATGEPLAFYRDDRVRGTGSRRC
ncbi:hypothetical protein [Burkholderia ubonensis]|nr:hypothetical protein [Burkholderia ubonensis]